MSLPRPSPSGEGRSLVRDEGKLQAGCSLRPGEAGLTGVPSSGSQPSPSSALPPSLSLTPALQWRLPGHPACGPTLAPSILHTKFPELQLCHVTPSTPDLRQLFGTGIKCPTFCPGPGRLCVTFPGLLTSFISGRFLLGLFIPAPSSSCWF